MNIWRTIRSSVRHKTIAIALGTTVLALLLNSLALLYYEAGALRESQLADLRTQANILGRASVPALAFQDRAAAVEDLAMLRARPDIELAALYAADGSLFATYERNGQTGIPERALSPRFNIDGGRLTLFHPIWEGGEVLGSIYLRAETGFGDRMISYSGILLAAMAVALAAAWLLSAWLQAAVTRPIQAVASAARDVYTRRDFSIRAKKTTEDEIGLLADALNRMLADLEREMAERRGAEEALKAADRRKDEFLATLAHELRNPLAPIRNATYIMQSAKSNASTVDKGLAIIDRQLSQMVRLVDDLLDVSRITTGKLIVRLEPADLRAVAQSALEAIEPIFITRQLQVQTELPPAGTIIAADPTRLSQVFLNLLNNAAKFTEPGGRIEFRVRIEQNEMIATVRDSGIGIAPEMVDELFEMFAQADRSLERPTAGLGVGLSLARRLVELHGGTLTVHSAGLGKGSEFTVRIPVDVQAHAVAEPAAQYDDNSSATPPQRILLVDDNIDFANSLALLLGELGHEVRIEHDGAAGLAAASFKPDIAFLDIGLPKLNGYDLARHLRNLPETSDILLVAVTGWGQPADHRLAVEAGFDEYLVKPISLEDVKALLNSVAVQ